MGDGKTHSSNDEYERRGWSCINLRAYICITTIFHNAHFLEITSYRRLSTIRLNHTARSWMDEILSREFHHIRSALYLGNSWRVLNLQNWTYKQQREKQPFYLDTILVIIPWWSMVLPCIPRHVCFKHNEGLQAIQDLYDLFQKLSYTSHIC